MHQHFTLALTSAGSPVWPLTTAVLIGALLALGAGVLHRAGGATVPAALQRSGVAFTAVTTLTVSGLSASRPLLVLVVLLLALLGGIAYGTLDRLDGAPPHTAVWHGAAAFTSLALLGLALLATYAESAVGH
ncbi:hypothetical protein ACIPSE_10680 [Streptomyces sp. NPDC090106]|uniref:hypothetical protein n=1 Tax=Streptomyces sp. NPDC090106 TaxID=3365946 RepID=UPI0038231FF7